MQNNILCVYMRNLFVYIILSLIYVHFCRTLNISGQMENALSVVEEMLKNFEEVSF